MLHTDQKKFFASAYLTENTLSISYKDCFFPPQRVPNKKIETIPTIHDSVV
jgi:hypothetical protein